MSQRHYSSAFLGVKNLRSSCRTIAAINTRGSFLSASIVGVFAGEIESLKQFLPRYFWKAPADFLDKQEKLGLVC